MKFECLLDQQKNYVSAIPIYNISSVAFRNNNNNDQCRAFVTTRNDNAKRQYSFQAFDD